MSPGRPWLRAVGVKRPGETDTEVRIRMAREREIMHAQDRDARRVALTDGGTRIIPVRYDDGD